MTDELLVGLGSLILGTLLLVIAPGVARFQIMLWGWEPGGGGERLVRMMARAMGGLLLLAGVWYLVSA